MAAKETAASRREGCGGEREGADGRGRVVERSVIGIMSLLRCGKERGWRRRDEECGGTEKGGGVPLSPPLSVRSRHSPGKGASREEDNACCGKGHKATEEKLTFKLTFLAVNI